jgi:hypothetical protein
MGRGTKGGHTIEPDISEALKAGANLFSLKDIEQLLKSRRVDHKHLGVHICKSNAPPQGVSINTK